MKDSKTIHLNAPSDILVLLDPGHGTREYTKGKCSPDGVYHEGEWSRDIAPRIASGLADLGISSKIIVPERQDIALSERCRRANEIMSANAGKKTIYISLHTNAAPGSGWSQARGLEVYVGRNASVASKILAANIYDAGVAMGFAGNRCAPSVCYWQAGYTVLTKTLMPAVLTESLFHTNVGDLDILMSERGKDEIASMHIAGIARSFGIPYSLLSSSSLPR